MNSSFFIHLRFWEYHYYSPHWFWAFLLIPLVLGFYYFKFKNKRGTAKFSRSSTDLKSIAFPFTKELTAVIFACYAVSLSFFILAMAKPFLEEAKNNEVENEEEGIDIMIAMDVSGSMMATDFLPNRLEAAKEMANDFIDGRKSDKIGFVVFEGEAYTACPATRNYDYLKQIISETQTGLIDPGTAIGVGLGTAVVRLRSDSLASKVIILLTDGENNAGDIVPMEAAHLAQDKNIKVYTIGVGKEGYVDMPIQTPFGTITQKTKVSIDEDLLKEIAEMTGGQYFRATDENSLRDIYHKIDKMETRKMVSDKIKREPPYQPKDFLLFGFILIMSGLTIEQFLFKKND